MSVNSCDDAANLVSTYWGTNRKGRPAHWVNHPVTRSLINLRVSGDRSISAIEWLKRTYLSTPVARALSVGCGFGAFERRCLQIGIADRIDALDMSTGAIEQATREAADAGLSGKLDYRVADLNDITLPENTYGLVAGVASVHHVFQLERLFGQIRKSLTSGGLLYLNEYIGPSRFQLTPDTLAIINRLLAILPERYRKNLFVNDGSVVERVTPPPLSWFEQFDPSESIRSAEIVATLKMHFDVIEFRPYGGAILHLLLSGISGNFDEGNEGDATMLLLIDALEQILEEHGVLHSEFAVIVARPRAD